MFSFRSAVEGINNLFVQGVGADAPRQVTFSKRDIFRYFWADASRLLYLQDTAGEENYKLYRVDVHTGETVCLTDFEDVRTTLIDDFEKSPHEVIVSMNKRDPERMEPYRLNFMTGEMVRLADNPGRVRHWQTDNDGVVRIANDGNILYRKDASSPFEKIIDLDTDDYFSIRYFTPDNQHVYAYSNVGRDRIAIVEYDPNTRREVRVIFEDPVYDLYGDDEVDHFVYSARRGNLLYALYTGDKPRLHCFDEALREIHDKLQKKKPGYAVRFGSIGEGLKKMFVIFSNDRLEGAYYLYDAVKDDLVFLNNITPWLNEDDMASMKPVSFEAQDGLTIHGYLTVPKGVNPKKLPMIVFPHAGPQWRNSWGFDEYVQFFANRGYAVLQVNFRGSTGYGKAFLRAGFKQWGLKMQDDISDGVQWAVDQGVADPDRVAIFGWSYGGYAALCGMTFTPELYACGLELWGITNYFTMYSAFPPHWKSYLKQIHDRWGDPVADSLQIAQTTPAFHVENIRSPLLVAHSTNDSRVRISQAEELVGALENHDKVYEYVVLKGVGHALTNQEKTVELMSRVESFLDQYLMAKAAY